MWREVSWLNEQMLAFCDGLSSIDFCFFLCFFVPAKIV